MATSGPAAASAEVTIAAPPDAVYALITDLQAMAALAEETHAMEWVAGAAAAPGAVFKGHNRNGSKTWTTKCTVTAAEPGRTFAFDVRSTGLPIAHWRYDIVATDGGCTVTEQTWDHRPGWFKPLAGLATGISDRTSANAEHIKLTLARLKATAESAG
ncbi:SRPBCC family protein [Mycobacterium sp. BMJ-28]